jgi:putative ABC transport system permease protein
MRLLRRLWYLVRQRGADAALAEEIELHRELTERHLERQGLTSAEASVEARRRLGNTTLVRDDARDVWGWNWLRDICQDARFAARLLAKDRRFTVAVVLALGLGIGVNNSVFSVVNTALIRQVPFDRPDRLLDLGVINRDGREVGLSYPDYRAWMEATTLEGIAVSVNAVMNLSGDELAPERLRGTYISANTFSLLRSKPLLGRDFLPEDDRAGAPPVVVIGYRVWQGRYGGDPSVIGRTVRINSVAATLVGVMPANFAFPFIAEAWQPLSLASGLEAGRRNARPFREVIARLADTADLARAQAEVAAIASGLAQSFPDTNADLRPTLKLMKDGLGGRQAKPILMTLMGAVALVLLIACANVANLLLARAATRSREIAIRASLGATRWRIVRALLVECLMLAVLAGGVGIACSLYGARALAVGFSVIEPGAPSGALMPYWVDLSVDKMVLAFVGTACLFSTLVFGLVPAVQAAKVDVNGALKEGGRGGTSGGRARRWTSVFIIAEVALTVVLLVGAGLLWRSFYARYRTDLVVNTSGLITARLTLPVDKYDTSDKRQRFFEQLQERLAGGPAFSSVAIASAAPLSPDVASRQLAIEGSPTPSGVKAPTVSYVYTGTRYFETLGIQVRRGRLFSDGDGLPGRETAVVDDRCAALYFPGADPIGQRIRLTGENPSGAGQPWLTIVGVTPALPDFRPERLRSPVVYVPMRAEPSPGQDISIIARGGADVAAVAPLIRASVRVLDPGLPIYGVEPIAAAAARARLPQQLAGGLFGVIALIGLALSTMGVYALTAYGVAQRTQEIGVRMALGAQAPQVMWLFLRRTTIHLAVGLALGVFGALATGQLLQSFLVETSARDPLTLVTVAALLVVVAIAASWIPSRRAARLDPMVALRLE